MDNDRDAPATKGDLQDLEARQNERLQDLEARQNERHEMLRAEMGHSFDELREIILDRQTELLKVFYNYSQSTDLKLHEAR